MAVFRISAEGEGERLVRAEAAQRLVDIKNKKINKLEYQVYVADCVNEMIQKKMERLEKEKLILFGVLAIMTLIAVVVV